MLNLYRFELFRQKITIGIGASVLFLLNIWLFLEIQVFHVSESKFLGYGLLGALLLFAVYVYLIVSSVRVMNRDLMKEEGPFLFLTPHNGYQILGAKLLAVFTEGMIYIAFMGIGIYQYFSEFLKRGALVDLEPIQDFPYIWKFIGSTALGGFASWALLVLTIYLSMALYKAFFSQQRKGGFISFALFLAISFVVNQIISLLVFRLQYGNIMSFSFAGESVERVLEAVGNMVWTQTAIQLVFSVGFFFLVGFLLDRKMEL